MKKIAYQAPEVKVKAVFTEQLMAGSGVTGSVDGDVVIGWGGEDDGTHEADAKLYGSTSVWDD